MEKIRCQNNGIHKKLEQKIAFLAKGRKCTYDLIAFSRRHLCALKYPLQTSLTITFFSFVYVIFISDCPSLNIPMSSDTCTCLPTRQCSGIQCCITMDIKVTSLFINIWLSVDPCKSQLSVGFGLWNHTSKLSDNEWGVEHRFSLGNALEIV